MNAPFKSKLKIEDAKAILNFYLSIYTIHIG